LDSIWQRQAHPVRALMPRFSATTLAPLTIGSGRRAWLGS
jgi:hypothetical protein